MPRLGDIWVLLVARQHDEFRMPEILQRLQKRMNLERTETTPEVLVLLAGDLLVAEEQHLMLEKRRAHLRELILIQAAKMISLNLRTQRTSHALDRNFLGRAHKSLIL